jgi:hypothetical protein
MRFRHGSGQVPGPRHVRPVTPAGIATLVAMTVALKLTHDEPRLVYLALVYHLGRPGSELDPNTKQPITHGLRDVKVALGRDVANDSAIIELDDTQVPKLLSAIYGCATELRGHHLRDGVASTVPRFTQTAIELFPQIRTDPEEALVVAEAMVMLHRRMERAVRRAASPASEASSAEDAPRSARDRRWPFRR